MSRGCPHPARCILVACSSARSPRATLVPERLAASNLYYILSSFSNRKKALAFVRDLAAIVEVAPADSATLEVALELEMPDFEDAMQVAAALAGGAERIVTRNTRDFRKAPLAVVRPENLSLAE